MEDRRRTYSVIYGPKQIIKTEPASLNLSISASKSQDFRSDFENMVLIIHLIITYF